MKIKLEKVVELDNGFQIVKNNQMSAEMGFDLYMMHSKVKDAAQGFYEERKKLYKKYSTEVTENGKVKKDENGEPVQKLDQEKFLEEIKKLGEKEVDITEIKPLDKKRIFEEMPKVKPAFFELFDGFIV